MYSKDDVIKGLEHCSQDRECPGCPYSPQCAEGEYDFLKEDALALIKDQEETISDLDDTIKILNFRIKDIGERITPYGKIKDVLAYMDHVKEKNHKQRLINFIAKLIPDDFRCGHVAVTFNDDGSLFISVNNEEESEE